MSETIPASPSVPAKDFSRFFNEKLRPVIDGLGPSRSGAMKRSLLIAAIAFVLFFVVVYVFFAPYGKMLGEYNITYWPLMVLLPATMAVISFSMAYILFLRSMVKVFRETLMSRLAEFIDPGIIHARDPSPDQSETASSLLFEGLGKPELGADRFRGRFDGAAVEIADLKIAGEGANAGLPPLTGLFFTARFNRRFRTPGMILPSSAPISLSGLASRLDACGFAGVGELVRLETVGGRQAVLPAAEQGAWKTPLSPALVRRLEAARSENGVDLYLSLRGDRLWAAMLSRRPRQDVPAIFDGFDFGNCREFCRDSDICFELTREVLGNAALWE